MTEISRFATHNEYPDQSVEGMDLRHLLHPSTNLAQHQQHGPMVLESAKGVGEAGTVGALAATMNAVADALASAGVHDFEMPATPYRVWQALQS